MGWMSGTQLLVEARDFSLLHSVHTAREAYPVLCPVGTDQ
jgi:hypothetical protein